MSSSTSFVDVTAGLWEKHQPASIPYLGSTSLTVKPNRGLEVYRRGQLYIAEKGPAV